jgi:cyanophycin synthetase
MDALPIVAIGGRWGKTTVARVLEAMLRETSPRLALWLDQGVMVNRRKLSGELIPWGEALRSLTAGDLDLAIQELDARMVAAVGLPTAAYRLDGALILNADDHAVAQEGDLAAGEVIYYALSRRNPIVRQHLDAQGRAVSISSGMIILCDGPASRPILPLRDVAIASGGALVFQVQNVLAAAAAAWYLDVPPDRIAAALASFTSLPHLMRGACNQFAINGATVIVDRLHDAVSARSLLRGLRKISGRRRRQVVLPDRVDLPDSAVEEIGRLVGQSFDRVLLHQPQSSDESPPTALRKGIAHNRFPPLTITLPDEDVALDRLLQGLAPNDLALVLATDLTMVLRAVMSHRPDSARDAAPVP